MACTLTVSLATSAATDHGDGTWSVTWTATPSGGTAPYVYLWQFAPPDGIEAEELNCPQEQTTQSVTLTLPLAPYAAAGLAPRSGLAPPVWLTGSCTVTDANFAAPPAVSFAADRATATHGQSVHAIWTTSGATSVTLDGAAVELSSSQSFVPFP